MFKSRSCHFLSNIYWCHWFFYTHCFKDETQIHLQNFDLIKVYKLSMCSIFSYVLQWAPLYLCYFFVCSNRQHLHPGRSSVGCAPEQCSLSSGYYTDHQWNGLGSRLFGFVTSTSLACSPFFCSHIAYKDCHYCWILRCSSDLPFYKISHLALGCKGKEDERLSLLSSTTICKTWIVNAVWLVGSSSVGDQSFVSIF